MAQAASDLDVHEARLRAWMRGLTADPQQAFFLFLGESQDALVGHGVG